MNTTRIMAIVLRQYYILKGSKTRVFPLFIWVAVDMVVWGFMTRYIGSLSDHKGNLVTGLLGAVLLWDMLVRIMQGVGVAYMEENWSHNLFNLFASPLSAGEFISGLILTSLMTSAIGLVVMVLLAMGMFHLSFFAFGLALLPFLSVIFACGIALGIVCCAIMLRLGPSAEWFIWPIPAVLSPFAAVFFPLSTLPPWMQLTGRLVPPSYVFENIRAIAAGAQPSWSDLAVALGLSGFYIVLACLFFVTMHRHAMRTGAIARYSAEDF